MLKTIKELEQKYKDCEKLTSKYSYENNSPLDSSLETPNKKQNPEDIKSTTKELKRRNHQYGELSNKYKDLKEKTKCSFVTCDNPASICFTCHGEEWKENYSQDCSGRSPRDKNEGSNICNDILPDTL